jgi:hypothetical protein
MAYSPIIILYAPHYASPKLATFVAECIESEVQLICVVGADCERVHDVIDDFIVGDGSSTKGFDLVTTWHADETIAEVRDFAKQYAIDNVLPGAIQELEL